MEYRTKDLAMAAYLNILGHAHSRLELRGRECVWVFTLMDSLQELITKYMEGEALVDPKRFMREVANVRNEMYEFLDGNSATVAGV